ncbi:hypothetical protein AAG906_016157 [Vitis piasezkii]
MTVQLALWSVCLPSYPREIEAQSDKGNYSSSMACIMVGENMNMYRMAADCITSNNLIPVLVHHHLWHHFATIGLPCS